MWQLRMALIKVPVLLPQWLSRGWMGAAVPGLKCTNLISQHGQTSLRPRAPNPAARKRTTRQKCKMLEFFFPDGKKSHYIFFPDSCVPAVKTCTITVQNKVGELKGRLTNSKKTFPFSDMAKKYTNKRHKQYIPHSKKLLILRYG